MVEVEPFIIFSFDSKEDVEFKRNEIIILVKENLKYVDYNLHPKAQQTVLLF